MELEKFTFHCYVSFRLLLPTQWQGVDDKSTKERALNWRVGVFIKPVEFVSNACYTVLRSS